MIINCFERGGYLDLRLKLTKVTSKGKSEVLWALLEVRHCDENLSLKIFSTTLELFIQCLCNHILMWNSCGSNVYAKMLKLQWWT